MRELSMHILDLAQNSIAAGASRIEIEVVADTIADSLSIAIMDNGGGMPPEFLERVKDPFTTTRTTRRVGLGIPMMAEAARACEGEMDVISSPGSGTTLSVRFKLSHIDRAPLGNMAGTMMALIAANPDIAFRYTHGSNGKLFTLDTDDVKSQIEGVPINEGPVLKWLMDYVKQGTSGDAGIS